ncbi:MAG: alpha/beta hydrolase [Actinomycetota bacterium]|nr:alpha/beta hydrolase [Actinomycetota bacterium]
MAPEPQHLTLDALGTRIHAVSMGQGPLVLFVHGFPESWYSWRHQLPAVADAGFRAVAIDVRGYGRSQSFANVDDYRMVRHVADNVGVVRALGEETAIIVGHDWGAPITWNTVLTRPDVFTAMGLLSVPYNPRGPLRPTSGFRMLGGDEEFYIEYFQKPGRAEAEIEPDIARWLLGFYYSASGDAPPMVPGAGTIATIPPGAKMIDRFSWPENGTWPAWLTEDDFAFYASEFERTGITGGLNRYRNADRDWEDSGAYDDAAIPCPSLFIGGSKDGPTIWGENAIKRFEQTLPGIRDSVIIDGAGHWVQQEAADEVNRHLVAWLESLR